MQAIRTDAPSALSSHQLAALQDVGRVMNATDLASPKSLQDAPPRAQALLTDEDVAPLREMPLNEAIWSLHLTLGHSLWEGLSLWSE